MNLATAIRFHASADFMGPGAIAVPAYKKRKRMKAATVKRINNPAPTDGPEIDEVHDERGNVLKQFRDQQGAENYKRKLDRKRYNLKESKALKHARRLRDGKVVTNDSRLRNTTGGTGGTGGPGNG